MSNCPPGSHNKAKIREVINPEISEFFIKLFDYQSYFDMCARIFWIEADDFTTFLSLTPWTNINYISTLQYCKILCKYFLD